MPESLLIPKIQKAGYYFPTLKGQGETISLWGGKKRAGIGNNRFIT